MAWYQKNESEVINSLNSDAQQGLTHDEAKRRIDQYGLNELVDRGLKSPWKILWEQLTGLMVLILIVAAVISGLLGEYKDVIVIMVIVVLNALLGFSQEYKAEQAMAALKKMAVPKVKVRRGGHVSEIPAQELVPGDLILLEAGNTVPADARVIESINLRALEAVLTGESEPVEKISSAIAKDNVQLGDQHNMLFMGTVISFGRGSAIVTSTGMQTELGKIADLIQSVHGEMTPLQKKLDQLGKGLALAALGIVALVFVSGLLTGEEIGYMFQTSIALAVAVIPEGLPAVVTIALALGAQRMLKRQALIRKLPAVETLGSVTVICSDKTGTLTENKMTVTVLDVAENRLDFIETLSGHSPSITADEREHPVVFNSNAVAILLTGGALCNDAILETSPQDPTSFSTVGDPTEGALVIAAARVGLQKSDLEKAMPRVAELPFDSDRKRMTTIHQSAGSMPVLLQPVWQEHQKTGRTFKYLAITKGAVDSLLEVCSRVWHNGAVITLDEQWLERIRHANDGMAQNGMRVLGLAFRSLDSLENTSEIDVVENDMVFVGMFGMIDPARPEAKDAVAVARSAGIHTMMITGDHPLTAVHIAKNLGITDTDQIITGKELAVIEMPELERRINDVSVFARVSPEHKMKIITALQNRGNVVAMTGDGVNDAPALKKADIGIAMGITGTDVSKEASDMVLLNDNFSTIVAAVEEGRRIFDNIRKFIKYTMTSNFGEIVTMLAAPLIGMPIPLIPLQVLWINLVTDGLPGLALSVEPADRNTMKRPPYNPRESIFGRGLIRDVIWIGFLMGAISLLAGLPFYKAGADSWRTMVFTTLTLAQMGNALATRSENESLFRIGLLSNKAMLASVLVTFVLQLVLIYVPFFQNIFRTVPLTAAELAISLAISAVVFTAIEIVKLIKSKLKK